MKRLWILLVLGFAIGCTGSPLPNVTPTVAPPTFINTPIPVNTSTPDVIVSTEGTPYTTTPLPQSPTPSFTPTATRTPTVVNPSVTPRPPTITAVGTTRPRGTPIGTPDCGYYDCMGVGLPNLPLLDSPTPWAPQGSSTETFPSPTPTPTIYAPTLIALQITPIIIGGTEVGAEIIGEPIPNDDLELIDDLGIITPVAGIGGTPSYGIEGGLFGQGGSGFGFGGQGNNAIAFDGDTQLWVAYTKGLLDPNVNLFGPFSPLVSLIMMFIALQFVLVVANMLIPIVAIVLGLLRKIAQTIANFTPF